MCLKHLTYSMQVWFAKLHHVRGTYIPKKRKVTYLSYFWNFWSPTPTWHQILKPIGILVTIFENIYTYIYTCSFYVQSMKKNEGHFWYSIPSIHPSHPIPSIRKFGPSGLACRSALDPEGTLKVLTRKLSVLRVSAHEFVFFQFFAKKGLPSVGENKKRTFRSKIYNVTYLP